MTKILGIDYGKAKIGLALGDTLTKMALPYKVLSAKNLLAELKLVAENEEIEKIVVGWPLSMSGQEMSQSKVVADFIGLLEDELKIEVIKQDERLTTQEAQRHGKDDAVAAMYILQSYFDSHG
jgi:putative holliday junction resolvase